MRSSVEEREKEAQNKRTNTRTGDRNKPLFSHLKGPPLAPYYDCVDSFMRCSMKTRRLTSSVKMACACDPSVVLCVTEGLSLEMRNRASDLCWSHTMYLANIYTNKRTSERAKSNQTKANQHQHARKIKRR